MDKGTIVYIGGFELPDKNAAAHRVLANGKILRELGYNVVFVGVNTSVVPDEGFKRENFFGFECWSVPYPKGNAAWLKYILGSRHILKFLKDRKLLGGIAGIICYNYPSIAQLRIKSICKHSDIKLLSDATEWYDASAGSIFYRAVKYADTTLRMLWVHKITDGLITTSHYLTSFYAKYGKVTVELPTLFDVVRFKSPLVRDDNNKKKFVYVGSPFDAGRVNKDRTNLKERLDVCVEVFFKLYEENEDFVFDIYGVTEEEYLQVFPEHAGMLREMAECISFNGRKPNEFVLSQIACSDFSIFFRDKTRVTLAGFPSKLAESISCGTPVISNTMVSLMSYEDVEGVFLASRGEELALVKKMLKLTPKEVNTLKQRAYASRAFDYRNYTLKVAEFLNEVKV